MRRFFINIGISLLFVIITTLQIKAQGTSPVGVNFVIVNFDQPPSNIDVFVAPLKYNKDFALSMQIDDADLSLFTHGYPVFEGGVVDGTTYPGLSYSDGCGNLIHFKMSSSVFVFDGNNENGPDIHLDNSFGQLSWNQMDTIYNHNWGILNHGVNGNSSSDSAFMDYSIKRNKSYIRRQLFNTTDGGVLTNIFVNPNGNSNYTTPAFNLGNIGALNQNLPSPLGSNGGNVNAIGVNWTQPQSLYRNIAEAINVRNFVDALADSSQQGANYWGACFTHSIVNDYLFSDFVSDFNYISALYGANGLDNILMATDEEIQDYLIVRDTTTLNYVINGSSMIITYSGEVPDNLRYYSSTIVIVGDATINNIIVDGATSYSQTGIGTTDALINLNWDGQYVIPPEYFADSMVTAAVNNQTQFNCWVAMDYVITLDNGFHKDSLRDVLCAIPNVVYDEGFCNCEISLQPTDTIINFGDCIDLFGAVGDYTYAWYIGDSLIDTTQNIYRCPEDTTQYNQVATNYYGCAAEDSILVNINFINFDLGPDKSICTGSCDTIAGPPDMVEYLWTANGVFYDTVQTIVPCPLDTTMYKLSVVDIHGATASDSITLKTKPLPTVVFDSDSISVSVGNNIMLNATGFDAGDSWNYYWYYQGVSHWTQMNNSYNLENPTITDYVFVELVAENECSDLDSSFLTVLEFPPIVVSNDTTICSNQPLSLKVTGGDIFLWIVGNDTISRDSILNVTPVVSTNYIAQTAYTNSTDYSIDTVKVTIVNTTNTKINYDTNTVCTYQEILLTASGADNYLWEPGLDTTSSYTFTILDTTTIRLTGTNNDGCQSSDSVTFYNLPSPTVSFTGLRPSFCENDTWVELVGTPPDGLFTGDGIDGNNFYPNIAGAGNHAIIYSYANSQNCFGYDTVFTDVYAVADSINLGPAFTIKYDSSKLLDAGAGYESYFWTTNETTQSIVIHGNDKSPGVYEYAVMGVAHGCSTRGSVLVTFENTQGITNFDDIEYKIFPNPNDGNFIISFDKPQKHADIFISNLKGQVLYQNTNFSCNSNCNIVVNLTNSLHGIYIVRILSKKQIFTSKIIIR